VFTKGWPWASAGSGSREARDKTDHCCGGDGTISEVANGILESNSETELGILPGGTGSDFRRSLRMRQDGAAARALRDGHTRTIDVAKVIS